MCGIWGHFYFGEIPPQKCSTPLKEFETLAHRGPDSKKWCSDLSHEFELGFYRLSIQDVSPLGYQPFVDELPEKNGWDAWMCNGEIYNHQELRQKIKQEQNYHFVSQSDCEVIGPWLRANHSPEGFDGVYAGIYIQVDEERKLKNLTLFRDPIGVRPLFWGYQSETKEFWIASEAKAIPLENKLIFQFPPGSIWQYHNKNSNNNTELYVGKFPPFGYGTYWADPIQNFPKTLRAVSQENTQKQFAKLLRDAVSKRLLSDRPIACLLSGGLDSSLIAALAQEEGLKKFGEDFRLPTFSIGFEDAPDLLAARMVAKHIRSDHHEIIITPEQALSKIPEVIRCLETWDPTTIRASTGMYLASQYIHQNTPYIVILSGEGADEVFQGYLYFHRAPDMYKGYQDSCRLVHELAYYDVLRADRTTAAHSLELRVPFLDKELVRFAMHLPYEWLSPQQRIEKYFVRKAFDGTGLLPDEILWRTKEAFSDGISVPKRSWFHILAEKAGTEMEGQLQMIPENATRDERARLTVEAQWFRKIFEENYPGGGHWIPHVWLPQWSETIDPSARTLESRG